MRGLENGNAQNGSMLISRTPQEAAVFSLHNQDSSRESLGRQLLTLQFSAAEERGCWAGAWSRTPL